MVKGEERQWIAEGKGRPWLLEMLRNLEVEEATQQKEWHLVEEANHCQTRAHRECLRNKYPHPFSYSVLYSCQCHSLADSIWKWRARGPKGAIHKGQLTVAKSSVEGRVGLQGQRKNIRHRDTLKCRGATPKVRFSIRNSTQRKQLESSS